MIIQITPIHFRVYSTKTNILWYIPVEYSFLRIQAKEAAPVSSGAAKNLSSNYSCEKP